MSTDRLDEEHLNLEIRKFLKKVGIGSQREIERAIHAAQEAGRLPPRAQLRPTVRLAIPELGLSYEIDGEITLR